MKALAALPLTFALTALAQDAPKTVVNWRAEHARDKVNSTNVTIDTFRGLDSTGTPAKAVWIRNFDKAGTYDFRIKYNPIPGRDMTFTINDQTVSTKGMNAKPKGDTLDCDTNGQWRTVGDYKFNAGANTLTMVPVPADGKLPHICQFEAILKN